jgi:hypothetical protein
VFTKSARNILVGALATASVAVAWPGSATAATAPLSHVRVAEHFDLAAGQMPENIALEPDGSTDLSFSAARQIARISRDGQVHILATLPAPADGGTHTPALGFPLVTGLVRAQDGTLYFLYVTGTSDLTGVWRLNPGGSAHRIAALAPDGLPNGLALDRATSELYVADSVRGVIWSLPTTGGHAKVWADGAALASTGFLGVNGIKIHRGAVWASNLDKGTIMRIPVEPDGSAGTPQTKAGGLDSVDDFEFLGSGDRLLATLNQPSQVALVEPDGTHTVVLTAQDGLQNPTSVAVRGTTIYVPSAAYTTQKDPNLLIARIQRHS